MQNPYSSPEVSRSHSNKSGIRFSQGATLLTWWICYGIQLLLYVSMFTVVLVDTMQPSFGMGAAQPSTTEHDGTVLAFSVLAVYCLCWLIPLVAISLRAETKTSMKWLMAVGTIAFFFATYAVAMITGMFLAFRGGFQGD